MCKVTITNISADQTSHTLSILLKITGLLFFLLCFPSFILTFSYNSCVSFQAVPAWVDFFGVQLMLISLISPIIDNRLYTSRNYWLYHTIAASLISLIQFGAFIIHLVGIITDGEDDLISGAKNIFDSEKYTQFIVFEAENGEIVDEIEYGCFDVTYGSIYYTIMGNLVSSIIIFIQVFYASKLHMILSGKPKFCCVVDRDTEGKAAGILGPV